MSLPCALTTRTRIMGEHVLTLRLNNPHPDYELWAQEMVVYEQE